LLRGSIKNIKKYTMTLLSEASFLVTPNGYKEDKLYAAIPTNGNGDMTFTRATTATRVNEAGLVELVPYNLLLRSQEFDNASFVKNLSSVSANTTTAPDGTLTADTWTGNGASGTHYIAQTVSATSGVAYTQSVFAKKGTNKFLQIVGSASIYATGFVFANFDLENGVVGSLGAGTTSTITDFGNGWYRCTMTATATATASGNGFLLWLITSAGSARVETNSLATSVHLWGAQLVEGSSALTYQKTVDRLDIPRIDYTGGGCPSILLEPQRTNLVTYSNDTTNASWNKFFNSNALISPSVISPDGSLNTNVLSFDGTTNGQLSKNVSGLTIGVSYTLSFYSKTRTGSSDLAYKILGMTNFPLLSNTSWVRNTLTFTATATSHIFLIFSNQVGSIELFGFQLEAGAYPTSYIPTTSGSVTRLVDSCHLLNHSLFTDYPFTVYANSKIDAVGNPIFSLNNTSSSTYYLSFTFANSTQVGLLRRDLSIIDSDFYNFSYSAGDTIKVAVAFISPTAYKLYINGAPIANVTSGASIPFNHNDITLGQFRITSDTGIRNSINEFMVFNEALENSELQTLTTL
jgi:hypothetical protein